MIVYISIGNTEDRLSQREWSRFVSDIQTQVTTMGRMYGAWFSSSVAPWQNACWCVQFNDGQAEVAKVVAGKIGSRYFQEAVSWAEVGKQEMLPPKKVKSHAK